MRSFDSLGAAVDRLSMVRDVKRRRPLERFDLLHVRLKLQT
jgi:hypothetical protein